jgi:hypothetical protein
VDSKRLIREANENSFLKFYVGFLYLDCLAGNQLIKVVPRIRMPISGNAGYREQAIINIVRIVFPMASQVQINQTTSILLP